MNYEKWFDAKMDYIADQRAARRRCSECGRYGDNHHPLCPESDNSPCYYCGEEGADNDIGSAVLCDNCFKKQA